jgi:hypothetical protein
LLASQLQLLCCVRQTSCLFCNKVLMLPSISPWTRCYKGYFTAINVLVATVLTFLCSKLLAHCYLWFSGISFLSVSHYKHIPLVSCRIRSVSPTACANTASTKYSIRLFLRWLAMEAHLPASTTVSTVFKLYAPLGQHQT